MATVMGYGGAYPDYTVGDARNGGSSFGYGDEARFVLRLRLWSFFHITVTVTDTGFVTLTI